MTPTKLYYDALPNVQKRDAEDLDADDSLQAFIFSGFDTSELFLTGAFDPGIDVPWPPDLDSKLHPLVRFELWDQAQIYIPGRWDGARDVRYGPGVWGAGGSFNVKVGRVHALCFGWLPGLKLILPFADQQPGMERDTASLTLGLEDPEFRSSILVCLCYIVLSSSRDPVFVKPMALEDPRRK